MSDALDESLWGALLAMQRHSWEQGVASHAALDDGRTDLARLLALDAVVRQDAEGRLGATGDAGLVNGAALGEAVALLAREDEPGAEEALDRQIGWLLDSCPRGDSGILLHLDGLPEAWVDTVYMVVPLLVLVGHDAEADTQFRLHRDCLRDEETGLWGHRYDVAEDRPVRDVPWASGNGWVAAGLARSLRIGAGWLDDALRSRWEAEATALLEAIAEHEGPDGRFHNVLTDPDMFTDGTAGLMAAFAAFTGVADGWLEYRWVETARRWTDAALSRVGDDGVVRGVCGAPHFDREGTSAEAQAFALLARCAARRLD